jgi:hypothetical protein
LEGKSCDQNAGRDLRKSTLGYFPSTGNGNVSPKFQQNQEKLRSRQEQERQGLQQKQEQEHQRLERRRAPEPEGRTAASATDPAVHGELPN